MEKVGKILPRVLNKHVRGERPPVLAVLTGIWPGVAGKAVAEQAKPLAFAWGTLTLAARCPIWVTELHRLREEVRAAVNRALGGPIVKEVRVQLAAESSWDSCEGADPRPAPALEWSRAAGDLPAPADLDPDLHAMLSRSFAKYFARGDRKVN